MNSPDRRSPIEPPEVDAVTEKLSALLDGELDGPELIDIEQYAVDNETTIETLSADLSASKSAVAALSSAPAPAPARSQHIAAALDAMATPEVVSLTDARVQRRSYDRLGRAQQLNSRLRRLTAVAAVIAVFGGIGFISAQGGLGGSDEAATSSNDSVDAAATVERNNAESDGGAASDDGSSADSLDEAMPAAGEASQDSTQSGADETADLTQSDTPEPIVVPESVDLADATLLDLPDEILERSSTAAGTAVLEAICFDAAAQLVPEDEIVEGITIQQGGAEFELVVLVNEELLVFELPQCVQVD